jgi:hypothetical protein
MNLLKIPIILISITFSISKAQLLIHPPDLLFEKFPVFNEKYIQQNNIKKIIFDIIDKKDWQEAEDKDLTEVYEFDENGRLKRKYHTTIKKVIQYETHNKKNKSIITKEIYEYDTVSTEYTYLPNQIIERNFLPNNYADAHYYKICGKEICKEEKYTEFYRTLSTGTRVLDKVLLRSYDSIATFSYENQIKKVYYNNEKLPYKEKFIYFDKNKRITEISEQLIVTTGYIKKQFFYNSSGNIENATMTVNFGNPENYAIEFNYDEKTQQLISEIHFKNNNKMKEYQYIYSQNNNELYSILIRTFEEKNIRIIKLKIQR